MPQQRGQGADTTRSDDLGDAELMPDEPGDARGSDEELGPFNPTSRGDESGEVY
jgi:hypothetical protein